jgi:2-polyprenyl-3-methyl-5-hydroxy-6-metoxy-1,4-benzoquinol methylase
MKQLHRPCPVCNQPTGDVVHSQRFEVPSELNVAEAFDVVTCPGCGLAFADMVTDQQVLDEVYEEESKYADTTLYGESGDDGAPSQAPWDIERLRATADVLAAEIGDRDARILDAGCATGSLLGFLKEHGFTNLVGLDPSPVATATVRRVHAVEAYTGSFFSPPPEVGECDVVVLSHVLEHLADVQGAAAGLHRMLRPGGVAYLEVPDATLYARYLVAPYHDFNIEHINHFSLPTLQRLLTATGFETVTTGVKVDRNSPTFLYPAIYGLWRKTDPPTTRIATDPDTELRGAIEEYVRASERLMNEIDAELRARLAGADQVIVWGTGNLAMKLLCDTVLAETPIAAIVDSSPQNQGRHLAGAVVEAPETVKSLPYPIVVTSIHHEESIVAVIRDELGVDNEIVTLPHPDGARIS